MFDPQAIEKAPAFGTFGRFDRLEKVGDLLLFEPLKTGEFFAIEMIEIFQVSDQPLIIELLYDLLPQSIDIHTAFGGKIANSIDDTGRTAEVLTLDQCPLVEKFTPADRALRRARHDLFASITAVGEDFGDLGNDIAAADDDHGIPDTDILPLDLVEIV